MSNRLDTKVIEIGEQFCGFVLELISEHEHTTRSLEEYLRAILSLLNQRSSTASWLAFAELLRDGFLETPAAFDNEWIELASRSLDEHVEDDAFEAVRLLLIRHIVDLHQMRAAGMYDKSPAELWLGWDAPSGRHWYNFFPDIYLSCALSGSDLEDSKACTWSHMEEFLNAGQCYE